MPRIKPVRYTRPKHWQVVSWCLLAGLLTTICQLNPLYQPQPVLAQAPVQTIPTAAKARFESHPPRNIIHNAAITLGQKLVPSDAKEDFGSQVAISADGGTAMSIGAYNVQVRQVYMAIYFYTRNGLQWSLQQEITTPFLINEHPRIALSADGNTAVIGYPTDDPTHGAFAGAAYIYTRSGGIWTLSQTLNPPDNPNNEPRAFGGAVSFSGDGKTLLVGAYAKKVGNNSYQGSAYVFTRNSNGSWTRQTELTASDGATFEEFGSGVALSNDGKTALIGLNTAFSHTPGGAYIFESDGISWTQQTKLTVNGNGSPVALTSDGNTAFVGGIVTDTNTTHYAVYVFNRNGANWLQTQQLASSPSDLSGPIAVSHNGQYALVGGSTVLSNTTEFDAFAFHFDGQSWTPQQVITGHGPQVALNNDGSIGLVGTPNDGLVGNVYVLTQAIPTRVEAYWGNQQSAAVGAVFNQPLVARVSDAANNPVSGIIVTISGPVSGAGVTFGVGQTVFTATTDVAGLVTTTVTANNIVGSYSLSLEAAGVPAGGSFTLSNVENCTNLAVTSAADDGSCGTLRQALATAATNPVSKTVSISLASGAVITLTSGLALPAGVTLTTTASCGVDGTPPVTLQGTGSNSGNGLILGPNSNVYGLWVRGFSETQVKAPPGSHAGLRCVRASKN